MTNIDSQLNLNGKEILVTDMASPQGYALAEQLVRAGANVHAVNPDHDACVRQAIALRQHGKASGYAVDLQQGIASQHFSEMLRNQIDRLHGVISNVRVGVENRILKASLSTGVELDELLGELAIIDDLVDPLWRASTVADPARVVLLGDFTQATSADLLKENSRLLAARLLEHRVNFNMVDVRGSNTPALRSDEGHAELTSTICNYFSSKASLRRGEFLEIAA